MQIFCEKKVKKSHFYFYVDKVFLIKYALKCLFYKIIKSNSLNKGFFLLFFARISRHTFVSSNSNKGILSHKHNVFFIPNTMFF